MTNWKTSLAGLVALTPLILRLFGHPLTADETILVISVAGAWGFTQAKDNNVTGGSKRQ